MAISYILATLIIIAVNYNKIPHTFPLIFSGAFSGTAAHWWFFWSYRLRT
ncbi:sodium:alanine symporter family protein, partial [Streptococcus agalactiae COH1]